MESINVCVSVFLKFSIIGLSIKKLPSSIVFISAAPLTSPSAFNTMLSTALPFTDIILFPFASASEQNSLATLPTSSFANPLNPVIHFPIRLISSGERFFITFAATSSSKDKRSTAAFSSFVMPIRFSFTFI